MAVRPETVFKRDVLKDWSNWHESYEPSIGSGTGYPDLQLLCPSSHRLFPLELKVGKIKGDRLFPEEVRPSQIRWHFEFNRAGGVSALLTGVQDPATKLWTGYAIHGRRLFDEDYTAGWPIKSLFLVRPRQSDEDLQRLMINAFNGAL